MKRILLFFLLLSAYVGQAQVYQTINVYGYKYKRAIIDSALSVPNDTFSIPVGYRHLTHIAAKDTAVYLWSPSLQYWKLGIGGGGGGHVAPAWGQVTGTLSAQSDLQTALNAKQNSITLGTASQYFRGNLTLGTFSTDVLSLTNPLYAPVGHSHNGLVPPGGLPNQILKKKSLTNYDYDWYYEDTTASAVASVFGRIGAVTAQSGDYSSFYPSLTGYNKTNWDNAYSWGNHASQGYLTNITGKVSAGSNVTVTGSGTTASPYTISSSGGGLGTVTYNANYNKVLVQDTATGTFYRQSAAIMNLTNPINGQTLTYNSGQWVNTTPSTGFSPTITSPRNGDLIKYDSVNNRWTNYTPAPTVNRWDVSFAGSQGQGYYGNDTLAGKYIRVWREGSKQATSSTYGITISGGVVAFHPALTAGENIYIEASEDATWTHLTVVDDASAYIASFQAAGGTLTSPQQAAIITFYTTLKDAGLYENIQEMWLRTTTSGTAAALGMKRVQNTVWGGAPSFTSTGVDFDGVDDYGILAFVPSEAPAYTNNISIGMYSPENVTSPMDMGAHNNAGTTYLNMVTKYTDGKGYFAAYDASVADGSAGKTRINPTVSNGSGFFVISRTSATDFRAYQNGSQIGSTSTQTSSGTPPTVALWIGGSHNASGTNQLGTKKSAFDFIAKGLTSSQVSTLSTAVNTLLTAFSANVY